jgi:hypothetical protein
MNNRIECGASAIGESLTLRDQGIVYIYDELYLEQVMSNTRNLSLIIPHVHLKKRENLMCIAMETRWGLGIKEL